MFFSIRYKLFFFVTVPILILFLFFMSVDFVRNKKWTLNEIQESYLSKMSLKVEKLERHFKELENIAKTMIIFIENNEKVSRYEIRKYLFKTVSENPLMFGASFTFDYNIYQKESYYAPYVYRDRKEVKYKNTTELLKFQDNPEQFSWWTKVKALEQPKWSKPYFDAGISDRFISKYTLPFNYDNKFAGSAGIDISIKGLKKLMQKVFSEEKSSSFKYMLVQGDGLIMVHPNSNYIMQQNIFQLANSLKRDDLVLLSWKIVNKNEGLKKISGWEQDDKMWVYYTKLPSTNWSIALWMSEKEILQSYHQERKAQFIIAAVLLFIILGFIWHVGTYFVRNILVINNTAKEISRGNFRASESIKSNDEMGRLFNILKNLGNELADREKETINSIFDTAIDGYLLFDGKGIIDCNKSALELFGFKDKGELIGKLPLALSPKQQPNGDLSTTISKQYLKDLMITGHKKFDWVFLRKDGHQVPTKVRLKQIRMGEEEVTLALVHQQAESLSRTG